MAEPPITFNQEQVYSMVEKVRCETQLSYKLACHVVDVVLKNLSTIESSSCGIVNNILKTLEAPLTVPDSVIENTRDMARLLIISEDLNNIKNDSQQRSWELFDDQLLIMAHVNEFNDILTNADIAICKRFLKVTEYYIVNCLAEYYQMESRWSIKVLLLKTFRLLSSLSKTVTLILLQSVLPLELTRDIQSECEDKTKLLLAVNVLTKMFSIREPLSVIYFDTIGKGFVLFLLRLIENPSSDPDRENLIVQLINLIVTYNLQFSNENVAENITIQALSETNNPKIFSETLLLLFNRAKDPVECVDQDDYQFQNSLLKMITDIFSHDETANLFYSNDVKVLIDIVLRQLIDNSPQSNERQRLLKLMKHISLRADDTILIDRVAEIQSCIHRLSSEGDMNIMDLIQDIECQIGRTQL